jgi:hypothetical protein
VPKLVKPSVVAWLASPDRRALIINSCNHTTLRYDWLVWIDLDYPPSIWVFSTTAICDLSSQNTCLSEWIPSSKSQPPMWDCCNKGVKQELMLWYEASQTRNLSQAAGFLWDWVSHLSRFRCSFRVASIKVWLPAGVSNHVNRETQLV